MKTEIVAQSRGSHCENSWCQWIEQQLGNEAYIPLNSLAELGPYCDKSRRRRTGSNGEMKHSSQIVGRSRDRVAKIVHVNDPHAVRK